MIAIKYNRLWYYWYMTLWFILYNLRLPARSSNATCLMRPRLCCVCCRVKDRPNLPNLSPCLKKCIYIYIYREREREMYTYIIQENNTCTYIYIYIYICIYTHIHTHIVVKPALANNVRQVIPSEIELHFGSKATLRAGKCLCWNHVGRNHVGRFARTGRTGVSVRVHGLHR